jgi:hypothetical protein
VTYGTHKHVRSVQAQKQILWSSSFKKNSTTFTKELTPWYPLCQCMCKYLKINFCESTYQIVIKYILRTQQVSGVFWRLSLMFASSQHTWNSAGSMGKAQ